MKNVKGVAIRRMNFIQEDRPCMANLKSIWWMAHQKWCFWNKPSPWEIWQVCAKIKSDERQKCFRNSTIFYLVQSSNSSKNWRLQKKPIEADITQIPSIPLFLFFFIAQICGNPPVDRIIVEIPNGELLKPGQQSSDKIFRLQSWERPFLSNVAASSSR